MAQGGVRSIDHAITLLFLLEEGRQRVTDLARRVGLDKSTVSRTLGTLERRGLVAQDSETRTYRLGHGMARLGYAYVRDFHLVESLRPCLQEVARNSGETACFAVLEGLEAVLLAQAESTQSLRLRQPLGSRLPLCVGAAGKAILAFLPEDGHRAIVQAATSGAADPGRAGGAELLRQLNDARSLGYVVSEEELVEGVDGVGVPVLDPGSGLAVASVSVAGPSLRVRPRAGEIARLIQDVVRHRVTMGQMAYGLCLARASGALDAHAVEE